MSETLICMCFIEEMYSTQSLSILAKSKEGSLNAKIAFHCAYNNCEIADIHTALCLRLIFYM